jgi:uncharacterized membrane protein YhaH (DUF805 family)
MDVDAGTYMTLVIPLALLFVVLGWWAIVVQRARRRNPPGR